MKDFIDCKHLDRFPYFFGWIRWDVMSIYWTLKEVSNKQYVLTKTNIPQHQATFERIEWFPTWLKQYKRKNSYCANPQRNVSKGVEKGWLSPRSRKESFTQNGFLRRPNIKKWATHVFLYYHLFSAICAPSWRIFLAIRMTRKYKRSLCKLCEFTNTDAGFSAISASLDEGLPWQSIATIAPDIRISAVLLLPMSDGTPVRLCRGDVLRAVCDTKHSKGGSCWALIPRQTTRCFPMTSWGKRFNTLPIWTITPKQI